MALASLLPMGVLAQVAASGEAACGGFPLADNGPFDYRRVRDDRLKRVEKFHFTPGVESLTRGQSSEFVGGDLNFVLRAFPNHHRALLAMIRLGEKQKSPQPQGSAFTVECWLERATRFAPDDTVASMIFAKYLHAHGLRTEAMARIGHVVAVAGDNAFSHYNAGLVYLEMKEYDKAMAQADRAYGMGFQRPELRERLQKSGHWRELTPPAPAASAASH